MLLTFIVLGLVVLFLVVSLLKEKINVNENRIEVKDLVYPLFVSNDTTNWRYERGRKDVQHP